MYLIYIVIAAILAHFSTSYVESMGFSHGTAFLISFFFFIFIVTTIYAHTQKGRKELREIQEENDEKKQNKMLEKEKYKYKKCSWCNNSFRWIDSGCRWHCCRRCEAQDS